MLAGQEALYALLDDADFRETAVYTPFGCDSSQAISIDVVLNRHELRKAGEKFQQWYIGTIKCLGYIGGVKDSVHSGLSSPNIGDTWSLPLIKGGTSNVLWVADAGEPRNGIWMIPVKFRDVIEVGGQRQHGGT